MSRFAIIGDTNAVLLYDILAGKSASVSRPLLAVTITVALEKVFSAQNDFFDLNVMSPDGHEAAIRVEIVSTVSFVLRSLFGRYDRISLASERKPTLDAAALDLLVSSFEDSVGASGDASLAGLVFATGEYMREAGESVRIAIPSLSVAGRSYRVLVTVDPNATFAPIAGAQTDTAMIRLDSDDFRVAA